MSFHGCSVIGRGRGQHCLQARHVVNVGGDRDLGGAVRCDVVGHVRGVATERGRPLGLSREPSFDINY
jgi:hypothetical protein